VREAEEEIARARAVVKAQGGDLIDKLSKLVAHERELEKQVTVLEKKLLEAGSGAGGGGGGIDGMLASAKEIGGVKALALRVADNTQAGALRELAEKLRDKLGERSVVLLGTKGPDKVALVLMVSKAATDRLKAGELIKAVSKIVGGQCRSVSSVRRRFRVKRTGRRSRRSHVFVWPRAPQNTLGGA
jgi:alanyl-tRNA synthetase